MERKEYSVGVTYRDFAALARLADWTAAELAAEFPGINSPEPSPAYFARVFKGEPEWDLVIPFRRVIDQVSANGGHSHAREETAGLPRWLRSAAILCPPTKGRSRGLLASWTLVRN